jgi:hypothetical protein
MMEMKLSYKINNESKESTSSEHYASDRRSKEG